MVRRAGSADLPLHGGRVPAWLGRRMTRLGAVIVGAIVLEYGGRSVFGWEPAPDLSGPGTERSS